MVIVTEGLTGKNPSAKVTYGGEISKGMTLNAYYPDGALLVTALDTATGNLKTVITTKVTSKINLMVTAFDDAVKAVVLYVQGKLIGVADELAVAMVESANLAYKHKGAKVIADLAATKGTAPLSADLRKVITTKKKHVGYVWQMCTDPALEANYTTCLYSTVANVTVSSGMKPQTKYWFRVATVEGQVMSKFSDPTSLLPLIHI